MSPAGAVTKTIPTAGDDLFGPSSIAFDAKGNGLVANETNGSVSAFSSTGTFIAYSGAVGVATPAWISIDGNHNAWIPSTNTAEVGQITLNYAGKSGRLKGFSAETTMGADDSYGLAIDSSNNAWFATNSINVNGTPATERLEDVVYGGTKLGYSIGQSITGTGASGGGMGIPYKISVDGGNNIWMANEAYQTVSEYSTAQNKWMGVAATGLNNGSTGTTLSATPDNSGNLWTANTDGSVTVLLGAATPTANPIFPGDFGTLP
jgi:hypothetical protein